MVTSIDADCKLLLYADDSAILFADKDVNLDVWEGLQLVIVALPGLFFCLFVMGYPRIIRSVIIYFILYFLCLCKATFSMWYSIFYVLCPFYVCFMYVCLKTVCKKFQVCVKTTWKKFKDLLPVLSSRHLSFKTHGHVYSSCVWSAMLHACETWPLTKPTLQGNDQADLQCPVAGHCHH